MSKSQNQAQFSFCLTSDLVRYSSLIFKAPWLYDCSKCLLSCSHNGAAIVALESQKKDLPHQMRGNDELSTMLRLPWRAGWSSILCREYILLSFDRIHRDHCNIDPLLLLYCFSSPAIQAVKSVTEESNGNLFDVWHIFSHICGNDTQNSREIELLWTRVFRV